MSAVAEETSRLIVGLDHTEKAAAMAALTAKVLARFAVELAEAGPAQLEHLAARPEGLYASDLGMRMRALVDAEHARRERTCSQEGAGTRG